MNRLLIANRGEIASRIIRSARSMGLHCIAVYSDADAQAPFVQQAHEAHRIGPPPATESYLDMDKLMAVAKETGAQMIHPGYGFLSENTELARRCQEADIAFIGPPASAIAAMGDKTAAKQLMAKAGVPLVPGYHGDDQDPDHLEAMARDTGYPLMIKASAGGGGKGMRVVRDPARFREELAAAMREARSAFGNDHVLLERFVERPRHVEVQLFFDQQGNGVYLLDRDCSLQRRHQKIIEEAPAPGLSDAQRQAMGEAALRCGEAIGYVGAGTVEFLLEPGGEFFFMEMNTRLQVEHPVTEAVTGIDLVEWQIRVARGESLPWRQEEIHATGHAVEARIYAENPDAGFLPTSGPIHTLREPTDLPGIRIDSGIAAGLTVSPYYDPMLAKVIAHGPDRITAIERLSQALSGYQLAGPVINTGYLQRLLTTEAFRNGDLRTDFIEGQAERLSQPLLPQSLQSPLALVAWLSGSLGSFSANSGVSVQAGDPWGQLSAFRTGPDDWQKAELRASGESIEWLYQITGPAGPDRGQVRLQQGETISHWQWQRQGQDLDVFSETLSEPLRLAFVPEPMNSLTLFCQGETWQVAVNHPEMAGTAVDEDSLTAPMHGRIIGVHVSEGATVVAGEALVVMEAMKMEHTITAPADGQVTELHCALGDNVSAGESVLTFEPTDSGKDKE
ncbi:MAG: acetyl/propionyl/methylcrotonyl-CoA carboxylase subunit alpha [Oleiphilaceae bacterium]|nr:acetyl/propionyl/methylcrotonyl-CoA carboxylase subunit alpha [Oleiphilaceae bacterium]